jgi:decaprenylphospho-beta-D-erythro-pentofuranosid-2-ulose 2-reductase
MTPTGSPLKVAILGAASGIAEATARLYAAEGAALLLAGRNADRLSVIATDLKVRGAAQVEIDALDLNEADARARIADFAARLGGLDHLVIAYGIMTDQAEAERTPARAAEMIAVNYASTAAWCLAAANFLEAQVHGSLVVLGSVAGDRGRRKNYIYGSTKAGIGVLVQGIAHRFAGKPVRAVLIKPGPTATAMTAGTSGKLASPEEVARIVRRAADSGGPIQYAPAKWRLIMRVVREIPAVVFNKLNF